MNSVYVRGETPVNRRRTLTRTVCGVFTFFLMIALFMQKKYAALDRRAAEE
jgi:hypothetical protein